MTLVFTIQHLGQNALHGRNLDRVLSSLQVLLELLLGNRWVFFIVCRKKKEIKLLIISCLRPGLALYDCACLIE